jgi:hypothetical protein
MTGEIATYWTEAERAGLKAMGRLLRWPLGDYTRQGLLLAIHAYVKAVRKHREG